MAGGKNATCPHMSFWSVWRRRGTPHTHVHTCVAMCVCASPTSQVSQWCAEVCECDISLARVFGTPFSWGYQVRRGMAILAPQTNDAWPAQRDIATRSAHTPGAHGCNSTLASTHTCAGARHTVWGSGRRWHACSVNADCSTACGVAGRHQPSAVHHTRCPVAGTQHIVALSGLQNGQPTIYFNVTVARALPLSLPVVY